MDEAKGYAASLRQLAEWWTQTPFDMDPDELRAAAAFIERQQAEIEYLKEKIFLGDMRRSEHIIREQRDNE